MILRKKALSTKEYIKSQGLPPNETPNVYYVTLTSCDKYGKPEFPTSFFDSATKKSFKKHDIQVITVHDLLQDFKKHYKTWDGKSDSFKRSNKEDHEKDERLIRLFEDGVKNVLAETMDMTEFYKMMHQNGINSQNALQELLRRTRNPNYEISHPDVYILLYCFIKRHRGDQIFVDEVSIIHSRSSKFKYFFYIILFYFGDKQNYKKT